MSIIVNIDVMLAVRKMSVTELSEKVGITIANISVLKNGKAKAIKLSTLNSICKALDCQPGDILQYVEDEETENNENIIIMTLGITLEKIEGGTAVGEIKTGAKMTINGKTYTAVVLGDPSGDGEINSADLLKIVKHLKGSSKITAKYVETAADVNNDDVINSADLLKIVKHLKGTSKISF